MTHDDAAPYWERFTVVVVGRTGVARVLERVSLLEFDAGFLHVIAGGERTHVDLAKVGTVTAFWKSPDGMAGTQLPLFRRRNQ